MEWHILDWAGNTPFYPLQFKSFEDAEEYLSEFLEERYEKSREEYEIEKVKPGESTWQAS